jgi:hypothetical protein
MEFGVTVRMAKLAAALPMALHSSVSYHQELAFPTAMPETVKQDGSHMSV